jgi:hypothetical protein
MLWHSGLLALLVLAFAVASYTFLRRTELARIDSTLHEQSEIVTQAMRAVGGASAGERWRDADTVRLLSTLHDLRARSLRARSSFDWIRSSRPRISRHQRRRRNRQERTIDNGQGTIGAAAGRLGFQLSFVDCPLSLTLLVALSLLSSKSKL